MPRRTGAAKTVPPRPSIPNAPAVCGEDRFEHALGAPSQRLQRFFGHNTPRDGDPFGLQRVPNRSWRVHNFVVMGRNLDRIDTREPSRFAIALAGNGDGASGLLGSAIPEQAKP